MTLHFKPKIYDVIYCSTKQELNITSSSRADMLNVPVVCPSLKVTLPRMGLISLPASEVVTSQSTVTSVNNPAFL